MEKKNQKAKSETRTTDLRKRAEEIAREAALQSPEDAAGQTLEETRQTLHELRVHQIELEMQNEELRRTQEQLDAERTRYLDLYDLAPVGYMTVSENGLILEANLTAATLLGVYRSTLFTALLTRFIIKEDQDIYYRHRKELFATHSTGSLRLNSVQTGQAGEPQKFDLRMVKKDGTAFWAHLQATLAQDNNGASVCRIALNDITGSKQAEDALRESEEKYRTLIDKVQEGVIIAQGGVFTLVNRSLSEMLGVPVEDLKGKPFIDFVWPEDQEMVMRNYRMRISGEAIDDGYDFRIIGAQGKLTWVFISATLIMWDGQPATLNIVKDITERKRVEETQAFLLQCGLPSSGEDFFESLARYLAQATGMDYVCIDRLEGDGLTAQTVAVYNEGMFECNVSYALKDTPCGEVVGKGVCCYPRGVRQLFPRDEALQELKAESYFGTTLVDSKGRQIGLIAVIGHHMLDNPKPLESLLKLVAPRTAGELERRRAEEEITKRESLLNKIFDVLPIGLWFTDENGKLLRGNPACLKIWGMEPTVSMEEYGVFKARRLPSGEEIAPDYWALAHTIKEGVTVHDELLEIDAFDGQKRIILNHTSPVLDDKGHLLGAIVVNNDITDRKRMEEEKRIMEERLQRSAKMEALGLLAGGVAHDLNNVLGIVVGYAEMVLGEIDEKNPLREDVVTIMDGGQRAAAIVQDMLTLARRGVSGRKVLNLNNLVSDFQKSPEWQKLFAYHPHVQINIDLEPDLLNISGSAVHLEKTLFNLMDNAGESITQAGRLTIKTTNQYLDKPISGYDNIREGDYVVLSVSDTGEGISETDLKRIFEPFYTKKIMGRSGTGLGLAVVWGTAKDHNGYINVESEKGQGTTFTLYFPVTREDITQEASAVSIAEYLGNGESILIVDDVKEQRDLAKRMLQSLNYNVSSAASGEDAVAYLKDSKVDLMVLDMIMDPGMDGLDTYKKIIEIHPRQKAIIVSGFSESDRVNDAQALGAGAYVKKPYVLERLGLAVKKELEGKKAED